MEIRNITNSQNFEGKYVIVNKLSDKPSKYAQKTRGYIENLIKPKDYNLYLKQDYNKQQMIFSADYPSPLKPHQPQLKDKNVNIPITSKPSRYNDAAKKAIDLFEKKLFEHEQKIAKEHETGKIQEFIDILETFFIFFPMELIVFTADKINPKLGKKLSIKFDNIIDKL